MEIERLQEDDVFVLVLAGRLDATWAAPVQAAIEAAVRAGNHRLVLDMAGVDYISSAGLRVIISGYKQLRAISGQFSIRGARPGVAKVIELSGLAVLLAAAPPPESAAAAPSAVPEFQTPSAVWQSHGTLDSVRLRGVGGAGAFDVSTGEKTSLSPRNFALGVAAPASTREDALPRLGEFVSAAGCSAFMPTDGASRPDFLVTEQSFVPDAWISSGLVAEGEPELLLRFEVRSECRGVPLAEIAAAALGASKSDVAAFVMVAEIAGLVGASLRQSPASAGTDPFAFPSIRDRLNFTSERAHRDSTGLVVGVVATPDSKWAAGLRSLGPSAPLGHVHAAVFPYRPIRKGEIVLAETVRGLFDGGGLQALLHLLNDTREPEGSGDSEFHRGACWVASISSEP